MVDMSKQTTAGERLERRQQAIRLLMAHGVNENELRQAGVRKSIRGLIRELNEKGVAEVEHRLSRREG